MEDGVASDVPAAMGRIRDSVAQMGELVDALLALSRLQAAEPGLAMGEVDVGDLVSDAVAALLPLAEAGRGPARRVGRRRRPGDRGRGGGPAGSRQPGRQRHPAHPARWRGHHHRHGEPRRVVVTVRDECGGIPADVIGRVFETGYRGTAARSPGEGGGSGLGLAIVAGVAAAHGGSVQVANVGGGCRFTLSLPARADVPA